MKRKWSRAAVILAAAAGIGVLALLMLQFVAPYEGKDSMEGRYVPDVVSSRVENDTAYLTVAANTEEIEDRQVFLNTLLRMYEKNEFYSTKFSEDRQPSVSTLHFVVYLNEEDIGNDTPVFSATAVLEQGEWRISWTENKKYRKFQQRQCTEEWIASCTPTLKYYMISVVKTSSECRR